jgi:hypothetical protein
MFSIEGIRATFSRVRYRKKYVIKYKFNKKYYSTFVLRYVLKYDNSYLLTFGKKYILYGFPSISILLSVMHGL